MEINTNVLSARDKVSPRIGCSSTLVQGPDQG